MRLQFNLGTLLLFVAVVAFAVSLCVPVAAINQKTGEKILPGMTVHEAAKIVGAPSGWYDGVGGISTDSPNNKKDEGPHWVGLRGEIYVDWDENKRVVEAAFYPANWVQWSLVACVWERCQRLRFMGSSLPQRLSAFLVLTIFGVWTLGMTVVRADSPNILANHGSVGLFVGLVTAFFLFADLFTDLYRQDLRVIFWILAGPILGAALSVLVAICRKAVNRRGAAQIAPKIAESVTLP